eukprot:TRINITY_DN32571_c0_g1_i1.p2 TRINITY_DN32571_c0_g1~~TRINITY_DN32571_c0_g1_i1.p2  ORF type:complete len:170 (+),score=25.58 TRINITY_DN32571_c0_g1_i1:30-539(+)
MGITESTGLRKKSNLFLLQSEFQGAKARKSTLSKGGALYGSKKTEQEKAGKIPDSFRIGQQHKNNMKKLNKKRKASGEDFIKYRSVFDRGAELAILTYDKGKKALFKSSKMLETLKTTKPSMILCPKKMHEKQANTPPPIILSAYGKLCLLYTSPSPRDLSTSRMPSSA